MNENEDPQYVINKHDTPKTTFAELGFDGLEVTSVQLSPEEWANARFADDPQPLLILTIDTIVLGFPVRTTLPAFLLTVPAGAMVITAITSEFERVGMGAALTAALDQVRTALRDTTT